MLLGDITDSILVVGTLLMPRFVVFCFICSMEKHFLLSDEKIDFNTSLLPALLTELYCFGKLSPLVSSLRG